MSELVERGVARIEWARTHMPVLAAIREELRRSKALKGLKIGMSFSESTALLGKPNEKKNIPGDKSADHAYFATWLLKGYSLDAQFSGDNRLVSYGIHWFGKAGTAPEFKEVFAGNFTEENKLGTRTAKLEGTDTVISWTKTPLPGSDKVIDVLTVGKK